MRLLTHSLIVGLIIMEFSYVVLDCFDAMQKLLKGFHTVPQRHKMLHTLNLDLFMGCDKDTLFIKGRATFLLSST